MYCIVSNNLMPFCSKQMYHLYIFDVEMV